MTTKAPAAYLRKSKDAATKADHLGILTDAVAAYGLDASATVVYDDWARSGDIRKLAKRTGWRALCEAIERGEHDVVFMNDLDRGGRSVEEWARFMRVARERGVRVVAGGIDWAAPDKRMEFNLRVVFAEEELERAKARAERTKEIRTRRGDVVIGGSVAPYGWMYARAGDVGEPGDPRRIVRVPNPDEPIQPLLDAVAETGGNILKACRLLNSRGIPARRAEGWVSKSLLRVVEDNAPGMRARRGLGERRVAHGTAPLSRLVACHCGRLLTPMRDHRSGEWASLYCQRGHKLGAEVHGKITARTRHITDALKEALADHARVTESTIGPAYRADEETVDVDARREALEEQRRRLGRAYRAGAVDDVEFDEETVRIAAELEALPEADVVMGPTITLRTRALHWDAPDERLGEELRSLVRVVRLGPDMLPVAVETR